MFGCVCSRVCEFCKAKAEIEKIRQLTLSISKMLDGANDEDTVEFSSVMNSIRNGLKLDASTFEESIELLQGFRFVRPVRRCLRTTHRLFVCLIDSIKFEYLQGLRNMETLLTIYQAEVKKLVSSGRLVRFLTSNRHRRKLERVSYQLDNERVRLNVLFRQATHDDSGGGGSGGATPSGASMQDDDLIAHFVSSVPIAGGAAGGGFGGAAAANRGAAAIGSTSSGGSAVAGGAAKASQSSVASLISDAEGAALWQRRVGDKEYKVTHHCYTLDEPSTTPPSSHNHCRSSVW